jgi:hypothetical protein
VVQARNGNVRDALREQIREAPRTIDRQAGADSERLAPVVARQERLPASSVDALRERAVVASRAGLSGPGARDMAPRGTTVVERGMESSRTDAVRRDDRGGRNPVITNRATGNQPAEHGRTATGNGPTTAPAPDRSARPEISRQPSASESWRSRPDTQVQRPTAPDRGSSRAPELRENRPTNSNQARADAWRESNRPAPQGHGQDRGQEPVQRGTQSWRSRSDVPPARRVIEGAVPNRRSPSQESGRSGSWRQSPAQRDSGARNRDVAPPRRSFDAPRDYAPRQRPNSAPPSRDFAPRQAPPSRSFDHAPAPSREAPRPSAPSAPSRSSPSFSSPRSSPPSHSPGRPGRN